MIKKRKRIVTALLSLMLLTSAVSSPIYSADISTGTITEESAVQPRWQNVYSATASINFEGSTIWISCSVTGASGTKYENGEVYLAKMSGTDVGYQWVWSGHSSDSSYFSFTDNSLTATKGVYRVTLMIDAVRNGVSEEIVVYKEVTY